MPIIRTYVHDPLPQSPLKQSPLLPIALLCVAGVLIGWWFKSITPYFLWLIAGGALALLSSFLLSFANSMRKQLRMGAYVAASFAITAVMAGLLQRSYNNVLVQWPQTPAVWMGSVGTVQKWRGASASVDVKLLSTGNANGKLVRLSVEGANDSVLLEGNRIAFAAQINDARTPGNPDAFNYHHYLITHHLSGTCYVRKGKWRLLAPDVSSDNWQTKLLKFRRTLVSTYATHFQRDDLSVIAALSLGDKSLLTKQVQQLFSETGTSHVLALSGLHLGILFSLFNFLLLRYVRQRKWKVLSSLFVLVAIWTFVCMVGAPTSLIRAACMLSMVQLGACIGRNERATLNNLAFAAIVLLVFDPMTLFDVGFQLSFSAVLSIILVNQYLWSRYRLPKWRETPYLHLYEKADYAALPFKKRIVRYYLPKFWHDVTKWGYGCLRNVLVPFVCVSLSAQWGTLPFVIYYFHLFTPYAWLANFVVIPAAYLLLTLALGFFLIPFAPIQSLMAFLLHWVLQLMKGGLLFIAKLPFATLHLYPTVVTLALLIVLPILTFAFFETNKRRLRKRIIASAFFFSLIAFVAESYRLIYMHISNELFVYKVSRTTVIHYVPSSSDVSYIVSSTTPDSTLQRLSYVRQSFFEPRHIPHPKVINTNAYSSSQFIRRNDIMQMGYISVYWLHNNSLMYIKSKQRKAKIPIDLLIVDRGHYVTPEIACSVFSPKQIVLTSDAPRYKTLEWQRYCSLNQLPCHDVNTQGVYRTVCN